MTKNCQHEIQHQSTKYCNRIIQSPKNIVLVYKKYYLILKNHDYIKHF